MISASEVILSSEVIPDEVGNRFIRELLADGPLDDDILRHLCCELESMYVSVGILEMWHKGELRADGFDVETGEIRWSRRGAA